MSKKITSIELFAGAGGLALGLEQSGFRHLLLNEFNKDATQTLKINRPYWNVVSEDIHTLSFSSYRNDIDIISGGFPCQAFSHSGKRLGLQDARGTLFYEFARACLETNASFFLAENVKGLLTHDGGKTLNTIYTVFKSLGYHVFAPLLLNSNDYQVAQKRERVFLFGCQPQYTKHLKFEKPRTYPRITLEDIFLPGVFYKTDINEVHSNLPKYSLLKEQFFTLIPEGGNWKNLPIHLQKEYLGNMFDSGGGKTGILRRLSMNEASPTIMTCPSQKQTERCHPKFNRPLSIRESARIQSFPDNWEFYGSISSQYKQIGNSVPPNLAFHIGKYLYQQIEILK